MMLTYGRGEGGGGRGNIVGSGEKRVHPVVFQPKPGTAKVYLKTDDLKLGVSDWSKPRHTRFWPKHAYGIYIRVVRIVYPPEATQVGFVPVFEIWPSDTALFCRVTIRQIHSTCMCVC